MTVYYVRKTGHDVTGNGSTATPWLTISKAITTMAAAGGHIVNIGDGTYEESTSGAGYLYFDGKNYTDWVTLQPENGAAGNVIISNASGTVAAARINASSKIKFKWLKFITKDDTVAYTFNFRNSNIANVVLEDCAITILSKNAAVRIAAGGMPLTVSSFSDITFTRCTFQQTGAFLASGINFSRAAAGDSISNVTITDCVFACLGTNILLHGVTNLNVSGCTVTSGLTSGIGISAGNDGEIGYLTTGQIVNCIVRSVSHSVLIGCGASNLLVDGCTCYGGDYALVVKENTGAIVTNCNLEGGSAAALYFKGGIGANIHDNIISASAASVVAWVAGATGNKCQNITLVNNRIIGTAAAKIFNMAAAADAGGAVIDYNTYKVKGTGYFGIVQADAHVLSLVELRAAWAGYGDGSNDSHSFVTSGRKKSLILMRRL